MADGRIERTDIFAPDVEKAIQDVTAEMKLLTDQLVKAAKAASNYKVDVDDVTTAEQKLQKAEAESLAIKNKLQKAENDAIKLQQQKLKSENDLENAQKKRSIAEQKLNNDLERANQAAIKLAASSEKLAKAKDKSTESTNKWGVALNSFQAKFNILGNILGGAFLSAIGGVIGAFKTVINWNNEFTSALNSLGAITGLRGNDLKELGVTAREMGMRLNMSAAEMLGAYEKVGSLLPILLKNKEALASVTEQAVLLTKASGGKLGLTESTAALGAVMNQFGLDSTQASRIVNGLAAAEVEGSATTQDLAESFKNVGAVASGANITFEQTSALLEVLASKQLVGAEAGTKLRGAILKLQDAGLGYQSGIFNMNDALKEYKKSLDSKSTAQQKDADILKVFGIENVTAGKILLENIDNYESLTNKITGTNTALEQAALQTNNASEEWKKLGLQFQDAFTGGTFEKVNKNLAKGVQGTISVLGGLAGYVWEVLRLIGEGLYKALDVGSLIQGDYLKNLNTLYKGFLERTSKDIDSIINPLKDSVIASAKKTGEAVKIISTETTEAAKKQTEELTKKQKDNLEDLKKAYQALIINQGQNIRASYNERKKLIDANYQLEIMAAAGAAGAVSLANANKSESYRKLDKELKEYDNSQLTAIKGIQAIKIESVLAVENVEVKLAKDSIDREKVKTEFTKEQNKERLKSYIETAAAINDLAQQAFDIGNQFLENQKVEEEQATERKLQEIDNETQKKLEANGLQEESNTMKIQSELSELQSKLAGETDANKIAELNKSITAKQNELKRTKIIEDAELAKLKISRESAIKIAEINRKQAIITKVAAIADITVKTAQASMAVAAQTGILFPFAVGAIIALGALQAAAVALAPLPEIPQYKKGTKDHKGGAAVLHGQELVTLPSGNTFLTSGGINDGFMAALPPHTQVTPADLTRKILNDQLIDLNISQKNTKESLLLQSIDKRLKNLKQVNVNVDKHGFRVAAKEGANLTKYLNDNFRC